MHKRLIQCKQENLQLIIMVVEISAFYSPLLLKFQINVNLMEKYLLIQVYNKLELILKIVKKKVEK